MKKGIVLKVLAGLVSTVVTVAGVAAPMAINSNQNTADIVAIADENIQVAEEVIEIADVEVPVDESVVADSVEEDAAVAGEIVTETEIVADNKPQTVVADNKQQTVANIQSNVNTQSPPNTQSISNTQSSSYGTSNGAVDCRGMQDIYDLRVSAQTEAEKAAEQAAREQAEREAAAEKATAEKAAAEKDNFKVTFTYNCFRCGRSFQMHSNDEIMDHVNSCNPSAATEKAADEPAATEPAEEEIDLTPQEHYDCECGFGTDNSDEWAAHKAKVHWHCNCGFRTDSYDVLMDHQYYAALNPDGQYHNYGSY